MAIKWRISLVIALILSGVIPAVIAETYSEVKALLLREMDRSLAASAQTVAVEMEEDDPPAVQATELRAIVGAAMAKDRNFCRVWSPGDSNSFFIEGLADKESSLERRLKETSPPAPGQSVFLDAHWSGEPFRAAWLLARSRRGPLYIVVGQSTHHMQTELHELLRVFFGVGGGVVLASALLVMAVVVWGLRPIGAATSKLAEVTAQNVGNVVLSGAKVPAEILPFVAALRTMLERLNEAIERQKAFISDASHELRTPVALAKSTVQLALSRDRTGEEYRGALGDALEDLRRMEHLTQELLDLARIENAPEGPAAADVDLAALLRELAETYAARGDQDGGRIVCELPPDVPDGLSDLRVRGDEGQLRRLFGNLLDNALRHGPRGGTVTLSAGGDGPGWVSATVRDQGGNIPPEVLPRLFDRFFRADPSRSHATGGAGLGLAIARQIVLRHGGEITLRSDPGEGTRAIVRLPR